MTEVFPLMCRDCGYILLLLILPTTVLEQTVNNNIYLFIYLFILYVRPFWPPGGPALRATRKRSRPDRGGVRLQLIIYTGIPYPVPFGYKRQSSYEVRTKAATAMNSDEASHPRGRSRERRPAESDERREARLHRRRERSRERRATESPQHREERLAKRRRRDKAKRMARSTNRHQRRQQLCSESTESRESRLQQMRLNQQRVLATETPEETEARLQQLRVNQQQRLASETPEETEARLQQLRVNQQQRLASETQRLGHSRALNTFLFRDTTSLLTPLMTLVLSWTQAPKLAFWKMLKFVASNSLTHTKDVTRARVRSVLPLIKLESATVAVLFKDLTNVILK